MSSPAAETYRARLCRVLEYIDAHLDEDLTVERLSGVAAFSKHHFHRQFTEFFGIGVYRYVQLVRLKRASLQLAFRDDIQVVEIALANGYDGPEAFARAFRKSLGQSPSGFRKQPQWDPWHATYGPLSELRINYMKPHNRAGQVRIVELEEPRDFPLFCQRVTFFPDVPEHEAVTDVFLPLAS